MKETAWVTESTGVRPTSVENTGGGCMVAFYRTALGGMVTVSDDSIALFDTYRPDLIGSGEFIDDHQTDGCVWDDAVDLVFLFRRLYGNARP